MGYAEKLQKLCVLRGLDQATLSMRLGVSRSTMSRIMNGSQEPKLHLALGLARVFGVSLDFLADDDLDIEPHGHWMFLSPDEASVLRLVKRLGTEASIDRLLVRQARPPELRGVAELAASAAAALRMPKEPDSSEKPPG